MSETAAHPEADREETHTPGAMRWAWYGLAVLVTAMVFSLVNLQMIYLLAEPFKRDLGLSDGQVGLLTGLALGLTLSIMTFPMGWLTDRTNRKVLLAFCVVLWSLATAGAGLSQTYSQLFLAVMGVAVGEAVLGPIVYSIIPDLFPEKRRVLANYIFFLASVLGAAIGLTISGALIGAIDAWRAAGAIAPAEFETWRIAMIASALPGVLIAPAILMMRLDRKGRAAEGGGEWGMIFAFARRNARTLFGVFFGFGLSYSAKSTMFIWAPPMLIRVFEEGEAAVGVKLGLVTAVSTIIGVLGSGLAYRALTARLGAVTAPRVAQAGLAIAALVLPALWLTDTLLQAYAVLFIFSAASTAAMSLSPTMLQDVSPAPARGRVVAAGGMVAIGFGALTPVAVGYASDFLSGDSAGLVQAMVIVGAPLLVLSCAILWFAEKTIAATIADARRLS
ncbi:MAG: MFS transporter [Oceanicaulis sp.]